MTIPSPPAIDNKFDAFVAWLRQPVQLENPKVPRFAMMMLSFALHGYLCSLAACLEYWMGRYRAGTMPGWDEYGLDEGDDAALQPRASKYKKKSQPIAPPSKAGAQHAQILPEVAAELAGVASDAIELGLIALSPALQPRVWVSARQIDRALSTRGWAEIVRSDRCRPAAFCRAAGRGGKLASKSFRLFNEIPG